MRDNCRRTNRVELFQEIMMIYIHPSHHWQISSSKRSSNVDDWYSTYVGSIKPRCRQFSMIFMDIKTCNAIWLDMFSYEGDFVRVTLIFH